MQAAYLPKPADSQRRTEYFLALHSFLSVSSETLLLVSLSSIAFLSSPSRVGEASQVNSGLFWARPLTTLNSHSHCSSPRVQRWPYKRLLPN